MTIALDQAQMVARICQRSRPNGHCHIVATCIAELLWGLFPDFRFDLFYNPLTVGYDIVATPWSP